MKQIAYDFGAGKAGLKRLEKLRQKLKDTWPDELGGKPGTRNARCAMALMYDIIVHYEIALDELDTAGENL